MDQKYSVVTIDDGFDLWFEEFFVRLDDAIRYFTTESERVVKAMLDQRMEANSGVYLVRAQNEYSDMEAQLMAAGID